MHSSKKMLFVGTISLVLAPYLVGAIFGTCDVDGDGHYVVTNDAGDPGNNNTLLACIECSSSTSGIVVFDRSMDIALTQEILINTHQDMNITVDGSGHTINISALYGDKKLVSVKGIKKLTLKNLNLVNSEINSSTQALINIDSSSLILDNVNIVNNTLTNDAYHLIKATASILTIQNDSNISQNTSFFTMIKVDNSKIAISDSVFNNNITQDDADSSIIRVRECNLSITNSELNENEPKNYVLEVEQGLNAPNTPTTPSNVDITDSIISTNISNYSPIHIVSSNISINNSTISNNKNIGDGGGLYLDDSSLVLNNSTVSENNTSSRGGGIKVSTSILLINNSTISGNIASNDGGGLYAHGSSIKINKSTISGNSAAHGGAIQAMMGNFISIESSTITNNNVVYGGGGIYSYYSDINISNTILSGNAALNGAADANELRSSGYNIVGDITIFTDSSQQPSDIITLDPKLDPLADNGGDTQTHALQKDSPAIDAGYSSIPLDQRGETRDSTPDIGAYEYKSGWTVVPIINYLLF